jgi:hypothetical protein
VELVTDLADAAHAADPDGDRGLDTHVYERACLLLVVAEDIVVPGGGYTGGRRRDSGVVVDVAREGARVEGGKRDVPLSAGSADDTQR